LIVESGNRRELVEMVLFTFEIENQKENQKTPRERAFTKQKI